MWSDMHVLVRKRGGERGSAERYDENENEDERNSRKEKKT